MFKNNKYDFIFSIGEACLCTQALRKSELQFASYPFDWVHGASLLQRVQILCDGFKGWFEKEDLIKDGEYLETNEPKNIYKNIKTGIYYNHDFLKKDDFDFGYEKANEKYKRRINRLVKNIENSKKVLAVYINSPNTSKILSQEDLNVVYETLKDKFGEKIELLYIKCNKDIDFKRKKIKKMNDYITVIEFNYLIPNTENGADVRILSKVLNRYNITISGLSCKNKINRIKHQIKSFFRGELW